jgi:hypothetical protein
VLVHEVYTPASFNLVSAEWKQHQLAYHTSSKELGEITTKTKPALLIRPDKPDTKLGKLNLALTLTQSLDYPTQSRNRLGNSLSLLKQSDRADAAKN